MAEDDSSSTTVIDDLPVKLLLSILSFLPTLDAIQTTVLSRKWQNLWTRLPSLSFDQTLFSEFYPFYSSLQFFSDFISRTLILRSNSNLKTLQLKFPSDPEILLLKFNIDSYIRYAVDHNLNCLHLTFSSKCIRQFNNPQNDMVYDFPFASLRNSSVNSLLLSRCNLTLPATVMITQFEAMKSLFLEQVYLTDEMISNLITGCANLQYLVIMHCYGMKDIRISSLNLKILGLWKFHCDEGSLEISAPNLSKIGFYFFEVGRYVLEVTSALVEADVCFVHKAVNYGYCCKAMRFLGNVERLSIQNWGYKVVAAKDMFSGNFYFYNLNHLELRTDYSRSDLLGMAVLFKHSPKLETVILDRNLKLDEENFEDLVSEDFSKINFSLPSLKKLKFNCYWGVEEDLCFLKLVLRKEVVLERIVLCPIRLDGVEVPRVVLLKDGQRFHVLHGSFPDVEILCT